MQMCPGRIILQQEDNMSRINIGTSGWSYKPWEKTFYPADLPKKQQFEFYTTQFHTVEINATFYRLPAPHMVRGWHDKAPTGFIFGIKGNRYITHIKRLKHLDGALDKFFNRLKPLKDQIGPILWQLPPNFRKDLPQLEQFLKRLPKSYAHAVEFRNPSWLEGDDVFELVRRYGVAHVNLSSQAMPLNLTVTSGLVYIRFHGLKGGAAHNYTRRELEPWAKHIRKQARAGRDVYAYFNNDANVRAPANAKLLIEMTK
jgi:uncharacterized protein YecE (DUF72 family)